MAGQRNPTETLHYGPLDMGWKKLRQLTIDTLADCKMSVTCMFSEEDQQYVS